MVDCIRNPPSGSGTIVFRVRVYGFVGVCSCNCVYMYLWTNPQAVYMSGGVLSSNPIGASGMIRFAEAAQQVRGLAGAYQVDGARLAMGHAYGGGSQFYAMWVVGEERP